MTHPADTPDQAPACPILPGVCSVTFRALPAERVIALAVEAGLAAIEWGTDVHLPPTKDAHARDLARRCRDAGLHTPTLGTYLRLGEAEDEAAEQAEVTALADLAETMGARRLRVWAGRRGSDEADASYRQRVTEAGCRVAATFAERGLDMAVEWHPRTLTDTAASAAAFFDAIHPPAKSYWQPRIAARLAPSLADIEGLAARLSDLHVYQWTDTIERRPLAEGDAFWSAVLARIAAIPAPTYGADQNKRYAFLEFVANDDEEAFRHDAQTLLRLVSPFQSNGRME